MADRAHEFTSVVALSATDSDVELQAGRTGWSIFITDIVISVGANTGYVTIQDEDDTTYFGPIYLAVDRPLSASLDTPIKVAKSKAVEFDKEAACDEGSVFIAGYYDR